MKDIAYMCGVCLDATCRFHDLYEMVRQSFVQKCLLLEREEYLEVDMAKDKEDFGVIFSSFAALKTKDEDKTVENITSCSPVSSVREDEADEIIISVLPTTIEEDMPTIEFLDMDKLAPAGSIAVIHNQSSQQLHEQTTIVQRTATVVQRPATVVQRPASNSTPLTPTPIEDDRIIEHAYAMNASAQPTIQQPYQNSVEFDQRILKTILKMTCELCPTEFQSYAQVNCHYREKHHVAGFLRCCGKQYFGASHLMYHITVHEGRGAMRNKNICCPFCVYRSNNEQPMLNHLHRTHRTFGDFKDFTCDICNKV